MHEITPLLEIKNLQVGFAPNYESVLHRVNFNLNEREILGICGESGSGKSVTALSIMNLLPDNAEMQGEIYFRGEPLHTLNEKDWRYIRGDEIGMVFQNAQTALNPTKRIGKQVEEALIIQRKNMSRQERKAKVLELLAALDLPSVERVARAYPHELSGGMRQRVGLAMAIINEPEILIADEPTTALDPFIQEKLLNILLDLRAQRDMSIILISHDIRLVRKYCDRILIFYAGQIVEEGPVLEVFNQPAHAYTKSLLASMPKHADRFGKLTEIPGRVPAAAEVYKLMRRANPPCLFANRCAFAQDICHEQSPPIYTLSETHHAACHFAEEFYDLQYELDNSDAKKSGG